MLEIVSAFASKLEYYSIDEFFFETEPLRAGSSLKDTALAARDMVMEEAGLPVTIGIARTRRLLTFVREVATAKWYAFLDADRRKKASEAFDRGIACVLN